MFSPDFIDRASAIQTCLNRLRDGRPAPHREAQQRRREIRLRQQAEQEELELRMRELQVANEAKQLELEKMRRVKHTHTEDKLGNSQLIKRGSGKKIWS